MWGWQEAWSNSPVGFVLPVFRKTHLVSGIMKTKQSWNPKSKEELNEPSGTITSHMSSESRDYASCYLGAVSRGPAASELTRGGLSFPAGSSYHRHVNTRPVSTPRLTTRDNPHSRPLHIDPYYMVARMTFNDLLLTASCTVGLYGGSAAL